MEKKKKKTVAEKFEISQSLLSTILKLKDSIMATVSASGSSTEEKNLKTAVYVDVKEALFTWFTDMRAKNVPLSGELLQQQARDFACILGCDDLKARGPGSL